MAVVRGKKHEGVSEKIDLVEPKCIRMRRSSRTPRTDKGVIRVYGIEEYDDVEERKQKMNRGKKPKTKKCKRRKK